MPMVQNDFEDPSSYSSAQQAESVHAISMHKECNRNIKFFMQETSYFILFFVFFLFFINCDS